jgi:glycosyltransferase involved in cell wall biosynthesis
MVTTSLSARLLIRRQLEELDEVDWTVVSGDAYDDAPAGLSVDVVPMRREFSVADVGAFFQLIGYFRRRRFDLAQTHTPKASFLGLPAIRLSGTPALYTVHGALYFSGNGLVANAMGWIFERWCCSWADRVLVQSREDASALPRAHICPARKVSFVGNGIDLEHFEQPVKAPVQSDRPVVLMVSRLVTEKGCADFFEVARTLRDEAEFVHVGPFEHDQRDAISAAQVDQLRRSGTVSFVGFARDVRPHVAAADIVVLPSYREGIPRAAMEAAAGGRPVVAYDIRGVREVIEPSTGLLVPRGDVRALTEAVRALLRDPVRREKAARLCQEHVLGAFSEDGVIERLRGVYADIDQRASPRRS